MDFDLSEWVGGRIAFVESSGQKFETVTSVASHVSEVPRLRSGNYYAIRWQIIPMSLMGAAEVLVIVLPLSTSLFPSVGSN